jgi:hypothetical protein
MYRTCLFCHADLGSNQSVEHLQVGRRIAFDSGKGRLWVVCRKCERWNLTPFDDRWEAMEECERLFRDTRVRFSTDEIGLARLRDGTELVRIGEPLRPEFAAWRYGDQFGRRRTRHLLIVGAGVTAGVGLMFAPALLGLSVGGGGGWQIFNSVQQVIRHKRVVARVPLPDGSHLPLTQPQIEKTRLIRHEDEDGVRLRIPERRKAPIWRERESGVLATLEGESALVALQRILPRVNRSGASRSPDRGDAHRPPLPGGPESEMNFRAAVLVLGVLVPVAVPGAARARQPCANQTLAGCTSELVAAMLRVSAVLDSLGRLPTPARAPAVDRPVEVKFTTWLRKAAARMGALAAKARKPAGAPLAGSGKPLTPFGQQTLALQQQLLKESAQFTLTSPELKVRHDVALNAIRNLK